jgi:outer membrane protein TolC
MDTAEVAITDLEQQQGEALAALALLLGRFPEQFRIDGTSLDALHEPMVGPGLPSELLTRRPDLRLAEANLEAAHADLLVARASMLPSLSLTAGAGVQNPALPATVLTIPGIGPSFALGGSLLQPIFDHGRLRAQRDEAVAKEQELLTVYRSAIVAAFGDVENALRAAQQSRRAMQFELDNAAQSERAFTAAKLRYESGSGDFLTLLEVQQSLYAARDRVVQAKLARLQSLVGLCKALGGGWTEPPAAAMNR